MKERISPANSVGDGLALPRYEKLNFVMADFAGIKPGFHIHGLAFVLLALLLALASTLPHGACFAAQISSETQDLAQSKGTNAPQAHVKQVLKVGISLSIPPWVIKESDSGIELDIMRESLGEAYVIEPHYMPFLLAYKLFNNRELDGIINARKGAAEHGFLSEPVVEFENVLISLEKRHFPVEFALDFLAGKSVVAFQKASVLMGEGVAQLASESSAYKEVANQGLQLNLLFIRDVDFILMDKSIFGYFWHEAMTKNPNRLSASQLSRFKQKVRFHRLFDATEYAFLFSNRRLRDHFNEGLRRLRQTGEYERIVERYSHLRDLYVEAP